MIWNFIRGELIDVIDFTDDTRDTIVWRFQRRDNAIKYGGASPQLLVRSWNERGSLHVAFVDDGIGIPREHLGKVFDKLYRVPTGNVHDVKGFGLGLSYVQAVMQQHGAQIRVVSTVGEGSTFTLVFPQKK